MQLVEIAPTHSDTVRRVPHMPRPPSFSHGFISLLWAIGLGAFIYYGSVAVGVAKGSAFVFSALAAFGIFLFVLVYGDEIPPRRQAPRRRSRI